MESVAVKILYNKEVAPKYFKLGLSWKTPPIVPGHFVMLRVSDGLDPLLRRPFGIYNVLSPKGKGTFKGNGIELVYQVVGKGTQILANKAAGEMINLLGPLGNGFPHPDGSKKIIMIAGGMGIVPLHMLAKSTEGAVLLYGARDKKVASMAKDFKDTKCKVKIATEDGSVGKKGLVTELLKTELKSDSVVYACGPVGMLKQASIISQAAGVKCYVSLERSMACGIGVCLGCAVKAKTHNEKENKNYRMVCSEGPVFDSEEIDWDAL